MIDISNMTEPQQAAYTAAVGFAPFFTVSDVALSSTQLRHLHSAPPTLVPAPGSGKATLPLGISYSYHFGTTTYDNRPGTNIYVGDVANADYIFNVIGGNSDCGIMSVLKSATQDSFGFGLVNITLFWDNTANFDNAPLVLYDPDSDATQGDGTLMVSTIYRVIALT